MDFRQRILLPLEVKVRKSAIRIREWDEAHENVFISFSGGLDSTVLVHLVEHTLQRSVPKVFVNTGLEFDEIRDFVHSFDDVIELSPEMSFKDVLMTYGYPIISKRVAQTVRKLRNLNLSPEYRNYLLNGDERGNVGKLSECHKYLLKAPFKISEECCVVTKEKLLNNYAKKRNSVPYVGISFEESINRKRQYIRTGCNAYDAKYPKSQPIAFWTRQDKLQYIKNNQLRICSVYGQILSKKGILFTTGEQRTGCVYCGMGCHLEQQPNRYQRLKIRDPKKYEYVMRPVSLGGLGFDYVLNYCNIAH